MSAQWRYLSPSASSLRGIFPSSSPSAFFLEMGKETRHEIFFGVVENARAWAPPHARGGLFTNNCKPALTGNARVYYLPAFPTVRGADLGSMYKAPGSTRLLCKEFISASLASRDRIELKISAPAVVVSAGSLQHRRGGYCMRIFS